ncbi:MAG: GNA1162 family protein [Anaeromyxobacteraceae bacterium]
MRKSITRILAPAALLAALSACASSGHRYQDRNMDFGSVRTVGVMPFQNLSRDNLAGDRVRDVFVSALLASEAVYVAPNGEVARAIGKVGVANPTAPSADEVVKLGQALKAEAIITGTVKEYGEVRSGTATGLAISLSVQMQEASTGKVIWTGTTTKGGVSFSDRLFGGGGNPMNFLTEEAVDDLLNKLFR